MNKFIDTYIVEDENQPRNYQKVRVAIIDSGFYVEEGDHEHSGDLFLQNESVRGRVKETRNFVSSGNNEPNPDDWKDSIGHGTQVARLVLGFAPRAEVVIAKVTDSATMEQTTVEHLVKVREKIPQSNKVGALHTLTGLCEIPIPPGT